MTRNTSKFFGYVKMAAVGVLLGGALSSCSDLDEQERFVYIKPADAARKVLIEDFTGQRCPNCPKATDEIHHLQETYGEDNIIAVGIHSGPLGFAGNKKFVGLLTDLGNTYYYHWGLDHQPVGLVNREAPSDYTAWQGQVMRLIAQKAPVSLAISNDYNADSRTVSITVSSEGTTGTTAGKLQIWLVEDGITAMQMMPDGKNDLEYVHNHVLRAAVNGDWGTDFTIMRVRRRLRPLPTAGREVGTRECVGRRFRLYRQWCGPGREGQGGLHARGTGRVIHDYKNLSILKAWLWGG